MKIIPLDISFRIGDGWETIFPVLVETGRHCILVDCGYAGFSSLIDEALARFDRRLSDLTDMVLTHHDLDHVGALAEIVDMFPAIRVHSSKSEADFINGSSVSPRLLQARRLLKSIPADQLQGALAFENLLEQIRPVKVDNILLESQEYFEGVSVISTPGHTPGHVSIYIPALRTLVAGDALVYNDSLLGIANPEFALDLPEAWRSVGKLAKLDIEYLICFHGGVVQAPKVLLDDLYKGVLEIDEGCVVSRHDDAV